MLLATLYHWSPVARRPAILNEGLRPSCKTTLDSSPSGEVCLSASPAQAWELSGDLGLVSGQWDLWQVTIAETDEVHVLPQWGPRVREVRVRGLIPADRCWLVASRLAS